MKYIMRKVPDRVNRHPPDKRRKIVIANTVVNVT